MGPLENLHDVLPTFAALFPFRSKQDASDVAGLRFDPKLLLHGQQYIEIYKPFPSNACVENKVAIAGLHDKGKATILELETISYEKESGEVLCMNRSTIYLRGAGGFSKSSPPYSYSNYPTGQVARVTIPTRVPSKVYEDCTQQSQALCKSCIMVGVTFVHLTLVLALRDALLYRLSGDYNPLHSDPMVGRVAGI
ncbi:Enoyl-CoA hydratase 2, peroxisomal [Acorus calamus]|uniref:Enoyl-CoA hydratase 2, peroxisomal n=1 Tax=Acorus calamus TaxID=4465 RepID=A0AAV9F7Q3_ACOCL|nr:Enoyl-CoA hydratase 2, peroxisomal [Acorus calamus]